MLAGSVMRHLRSILLVSASCALLQCGSGGGARTGALSPEALALLSPAPSSYGDEASIKPQPDTRRMVSAFEGALTPTAKPTFTHDATLDLAAAVIAASAGERGERPPRAVAQWMLWKAGSTALYARADVAIGEGSAGEQQLNFRIVELAGRLQTAAVPQAFGLARVSRGGSIVQAIVLAHRPATVDPFPKAPAPGSAITLKIKPVGAYTDLVVHADGEGSAVRDVRMTAAQDGSFSASVPVPSTPGRYFVEVSAVDVRASAAAPENPLRRPVAWAPIYAGIPEASAPDPDLMTPPSPAPAAGYAQAIVALYDAARAKAGKKPLAPEGRVTALAQKHANAAAIAERELGLSPTLADDLAAAGAPPHDYAGVNDNFDSAAAHVALGLLSPSWRRRMLGADTLVLGVGTSARAPDAQGAEHAIVAIAVEPAPRFDAARDVPKVFAALDAQRTADGQKPFGRDEDITKMVQGFANEVCQGQRKPGQTKTLIDRTAAFGSSKYKQWSSSWRVGYDIQRWQETSALANVKDPPLPFVAVGACQGEISGKTGAIYLVVLQYSP